MINLILQDRQPVIYGDGKQKRSFSDIEDCLYCLDKMLTDPKIKSETINIGPDEGFISINELYGIISNKMKYNKSAIYVPDRPNEVKYANCSSEKARKVLNYETSVNLDQSLDKLIEYINLRGPKKFKYNYDLEIENEKTPKTWKEKFF